MKFLALRHALEKALPSSPSKPPSPEGSSNQSLDTTKSAVLYPFILGISKGVQDGISRDPVDVTARLVTSKAPWWAKPPPELKQITERKKNKMATNKVNERGGDREYARENNGLVSLMGPDGERVFKLSDVAALCVDEMKKDIPKGLREMALSAKECREMLDISTAQAGSIMREFRQTSTDLMTLLRDTRFATVNETRQIMSQLRDVREFFLGDKHQEQVKRLAEFVDLCELLQKLKQSGFLDSVADTILKLS